eukprot:scaffold22602_cov154-Cylindrotheca_fusiformis.AAC.8
MSSISSCNVVFIEDCVYAYFEDQADIMNWDDNFDGDKYENYQFYICPTCTEDGDGIKLGFFMDETCTTVSSFSFGEVSNGWNLPYSSESGGLVSTKCVACLKYDGDQGGYELRDMCLELYKNA